MKKLQRHRSALAVGLAIAALGPRLALAAPEVAHWTVTDLGTLGGTASSATGINNLGQVAGYSFAPGNTATLGYVYASGGLSGIGTLGGGASFGYAINDAGQVTGGASTVLGDYHAFRYQAGTMTDLGTLGGTASYGYGINATGAVAGTSLVGGDTTFHAFVSSGGNMTDLGGLGGNYSVAYAINDASQVAGFSFTAIGDAHAFVYTGGAMKDLGTLGGASSHGYGITNAGHVTGDSDTWGNGAANGPQHGFLYRNGGMTDLGTLGGTFSSGNSINGADQITGRSTTLDGATHAFLYSNGSMADTNAFNGVAGSGWTLGEGMAINDRGQLTGNGKINGADHAFLLTLDTATWQSASSGAWQGDGNGWAHGTAPNNALTRVFIDPVQSITVGGPTGNVTLKTLTIGGDAAGNNGIATLRLAAGVIDVVGDGGGRFTTVNAKGVLTGDGVLGGAVNNLGTVTAANLTLTGGLTNRGLVNGSGRLNTSLANTETGAVRVGAGETLVLHGNGHDNAGSVEVRGGGELQATGGFSNRPGGTVRLDDATVRFADGLANAGQVQVSYGGATLYGSIITSSGGKIILSGGSNTTFQDAVEVQAGGELRVSEGATAVFFGAVVQRTGALFTGTGSKFYEGGLSVGASPGLGIDAGNVAFGSANVYLAELGGVASGTGYDHYQVGGTLTLQGTLSIVSYGGFIAQAGQTFDLLDWGALSGRFDSVDTGALQLADGTRLDLSRLYVDGTVSVSAVPELPASLLMLAGVTGLLLRRRTPRGRPSAACCTGRSAA